MFIFNLIKEINGKRPVGIIMSKRSIYGHSKYLYTGFIFGINGLIFTLDISLFKLITYFISTGFIYCVY